MQHGTVTSVRESLDTYQLVTGWYLLVDKGIPMVTGHIWCTSLIVLSCLLFFLGHIWPGAHESLDALLWIHVHPNNLRLRYHIEQLILN